MFRRDPGVERLDRWRVVAAVLLGLATGVAGSVVFPRDASAFSLIDSYTTTPRRVVKYCVESAPPGVTVPQAKALLDNAIAHWETPTAFGSGDAVNLVRGNCSQNPDVTISADNITQGLARTVPPDADEIVFDTKDANGVDIAWWDGLGTRGANEWCYECILVHEIGHSLGVGHAGGGKWTFDGNYLPSMAQCGSEADAAVLDTLQQDDWGSATYIERASRGYDGFWNANAGYESDFAFWARSSTSQITVGSSYAQAGSRGVRMAANGNWVYMTSVFDPYHPVNDPINNMTLDADLTVRTHYRHAATSTTGGVKVQYDTRFLQYDTTDCKRTADPDAEYTAWSGVTDLKSCGDQGTVWKKCKGTVNIDNSLDNPATVLRAYARSTSTGALYLDKTGVYGGTTP